VKSISKKTLEPEAILKEPSFKTPKDEYKIRVRVSLRALWALYDMRHLLTFTNSKLFAWQLWSHGGFYKLFFIIQNIAHLGAFASPILEKKGHRSKLLYLLNYFVLLNLASAHAFVKFIFRQKQVMWTPRKG